MKILFVHNRYQQEGGEEVCVRSEIAALHEAGLDVSEFTVQNRSTFGASVNAFLAPFGKGEEAELETLLSQSRPALIHAHNLFPLLSPRVFKKAKQLGIKTLLTLHNYRPLCLNGLFLTPDKEICERCAPGNYWPGILRGCYRTSRLQSAGLAMHLMAARERGWYDAVDQFIAPTLFLSEKYTLYGFPKEKILVQGHFLPDFPKEDPSAPEPYVLYVGRLSEEKGIRWLLNTFLDPPLRLRLKVAGDGPLDQELQAACGPSIEKLGYITGSEKTTALRRASALIVPSECYESFSLAIAEANAWGVPALVCDRGTLSNMVVPGENGDRYVPGNAPSFWKALRSLIESPEIPAQRRRCQNYARDRFSKSRFVEGRLALYDRVLTDHGPLPLS